MRKAPWIFSFLFIQIVSFGWGVPKVFPKSFDGQHDQFEKLTLSAPMEMELPEEKLIAENNNCPRYGGIQYNVEDSPRPSQISRRENLDFIKQTSPRLYLRIKVFRN